MGGIACGIIPARLGAVSGALTYSQGWVAFVVGSMLGYTIIMAVMAVIWSSVVTLFVCFAEDPTALYHTKPQEYQRLVTAWRERNGGSVPIGVELPPDSMDEEQRGTSQVVDMGDDGYREYNDGRTGPVNV